MRRVKVLHFSSDSDSIWPFFSAIADHANRALYEVSFCTLGPKGRLQDEIRQRGLEASSLDCASRSRYPAAVLRLARRLTEERIDVLETHLFDACAVGLAAASLARTPLKIFRGHHSHEVFLYPRRAEYLVDWLGMRSLSNKVIVHCRAMGEEMIRATGVPPSRIGVLPLPFEFSRWTSTNEKRAAVRARYGITNKIVLGTVSRLYWVKDQKSLIEAFAPAAARWPDAVLLLVGTGPDRSALERLAAERGIASKVVFTGFCEDIVHVMDAIDVLIHPAIAESFGQVVIEAFALSKPVISTRVGISPEVVVDGVNGLLVDSSSPPALTRAIDSMMIRRSNWRAMGENGRARVAPFAAVRVIPAYENQYREWLK